MSTSTGVRIALRAFIHRAEWSRALLAVRGCLAAGNPVAVVPAAELIAKLRGVVEAPTEEPAARAAAFRATLCFVDALVASRAALDEATVRDLLQLVLSERAAAAADVRSGAESGGSAAGGGSNGDREVSLSAEVLLEIVRAALQQRVPIAAADQDALCEVLSLCGTAADVAAARALFASSLTCSTAAAAPASVESAVSQGNAPLPLTNRELLDLLGALELSAADSGGVPAAEMERAVLDEMRQQSCTWASALATVVAAKCVATVAATAPVTLQLLRMTVKSGAWAPAIRLLAARRVVVGAGDAHVRVAGDAAAADLATLGLQATAALATAESLQVAGPHSHRCPVTMSELCATTLDCVRMLLRSAVRVTPSAVAQSVGDAVKTLKFTFEAPEVGSASSSSSSSKITDSCDSEAAGEAWRRSIPVEALSFLSDATAVLPVGQLGPEVFFNAAALFTRTRTTTATATAAVTAGGTTARRRGRASAGAARHGAVPCGAPSRHVGDHSGLVRLLRLEHAHRGDVLGCVAGLLCELPRSLPPSQARHRPGSTPSGAGVRTRITRVEVLHLLHEVAAVGSAAVAGGQGGLLAAVLRGLQEIQLDHRRPRVAPHTALDLLVIDDDGAASVLDVTALARDLVQSLGENHSNACDAENAKVLMALLPFSRLYDATATAVCAAMPATCEELVALVKQHAPRLCMGASEATLMNLVDALTTSPHFAPARWDEVLWLLQHRPKQQQLPRSTSASTSSSATSSTTQHTALTVEVVRSASPARAIRADLRTTVGSAPPDSSPSPAAAAATRHRQTLQQIIQRGDMSGARRHYSAHQTAFSAQGDFEAILPLVRASYVVALLVTERMAALELTSAAVALASLSCAVRDEAAPHRAEIATRALRVCPARLEMEERAKIASLLCQIAGGEATSTARESTAALLREARILTRESLTADLGELAQVLDACHAAGDAKTAMRHLGQFFDASCTTSLPFSLPSDTAPSSAMVDVAVDSEPSVDVDPVTQDATLTSMLRQLCDLLEAAGNNGTTMPTQLHEWLLLVLPSARSSCDVQILRRLVLAAAGPQFIHELLGAVAESNDDTLFVLLLPAVVQLLRRLRAQAAGMASLAAAAQQHQQQQPPFAESDVAAAARAARHKVEVLAIKPVSLLKARLWLLYLESGSEWSPFNAVFLPAREDPASSPAMLQQLDRTMISILADAAEAKTASIAEGRMGLSSWRHQGDEPAGGRLAAASQIARRAVPPLLSPILQTAVQIVATTLSARTPTADGHAQLRNAATDIASACERQLEHVRWDAVAVPGAAVGETTIGSGGTAQSLGHQMFIVAAQLAAAPGNAAIVRRWLGLLRRAAVPTLLPPVARFLRDELLNEQSEISACQLPRAASGQGAVLHAYLAEVLETVVETEGGGGEDFAAGLCVAMIQLWRLVRRCSIAPSDLSPLLEGPAATSTATLELIRALRPGVEVSLAQLQHCALCSADEATSNALIRTIVVSRRTLIRTQRDACDVAASFAALAPTQWRASLAVLGLLCEDTASAPGGGGNATDSEASCDRGDVGGGSADEVTHEGALIATLRELRGHLPLRPTLSIISQLRSARYEEANRAAAAAAAANSKRREERGGEGCNEGGRSASLRPSLWTLIDEVLPGAPAVAAVVKDALRLGIYRHVAWSGAQRRPLVPVGAGAAAAAATELVVRMFQQELTEATFVREAMFKLARTRKTGVVAPVPSTTDGMFSPSTTVLTDVELHRYASDWHRALGLAAVAPQHARLLVSFALSRRPLSFPVPAILALKEGPPRSSSLACPPLAVVVFNTSFVCALAAKAQRRGALLRTKASLHVPLDLAEAEALRQTPAEVSAAARLSAPAPSDCSVLNARKHFAAVAANTAPHVAPRQYLMLAETAMSCAALLDAEAPAAASSATLVETAVQVLRELPSTVVSPAVPPRTGKTVVAGLLRHLVLLCTREGRAARFGVGELATLWRALREHCGDAVANPRVVAHLVRLAIHAAMPGHQKQQPEAHEDERRRRVVGILQNIVDWHISSVTSGANTPQRFANDFVSLLAATQPPALPAAKDAFGVEVPAMVAAASASLREAAVAVRADLEALREVFLHPPLEATRCHWRSPAAPLPPRVLFRAMLSRHQRGEQGAARGPRKAHRGALLRAQRFISTHNLGSCAELVVDEFAAEASRWAHEAAPKKNIATTSAAAGPSLAAEHGVLPISSPRTALLSRAPPAVFPPPAAMVRGAVRFATEGCFVSEELPLVGDVATAGETRVARRRWSAGIASRVLNASLEYAAHYLALFSPPAAISPVAPHGPNTAPFSAEQLVREHLLALAGRGVFLQGVGLQVTLSRLAVGGAESPVPTVVATERLRNAWGVPRTQGDAEAVLLLALRRLEHLGGLSAPVVEAQGAPVSAAAAYQDLLELLHLIAAGRHEGNHNFRTSPPPPPAILTCTAADAARATTAESMRGDLRRVLFRLVPALRDYRSRHDLNARDMLLFLTGRSRGRERVVEEVSRLLESSAATREALAELIDELVARGRRDGQLLDSRQFLELCQFAALRQWPELVLRAFSRLRAYAGHILLGVFDALFVACHALAAESSGGAELPSAHDATNPNFLGKVLHDGLVLCAPTALGEAAVVSLMALATSVPALDPVAGELRYHHARVVAAALAAANPAFRSRVFRSVGAPALRALTAFEPSTLDPEATRLALRRALFMARLVADARGLDCVALAPPDVATMGKFVLRNPHCSWADAARCYSALVAIGSEETHSNAHTEQHQQRLWAAAPANSVNALLKHACQAFPRTATPPERFLRGLVEMLQNGPLAAHAAPLVRVEIACECALLVIQTLPPQPQLLLQLVNVILRPDAAVAPDSDDTKTAAEYLDGRIHQVLASAVALFNQLDPFIVRSNARGVAELIAHQLGFAGRDGPGVRRSFDVKATIELARTLAAELALADLVKIGAQQLVAALSGGSATAPSSGVSATAAAALQCVSTTFACAALEHQSRAVASPSATARSRRAAQAEIVHFTVECARHGSPFVWPLVEMLEPHAMSADPTLSHALSTSLRTVGACTVAIAAGSSFAPDAARLSERLATAAGTSQLSAVLEELATLHQSIARHAALEDSEDLIDLLRRRAWRELGVAAPRLAARCDEPAVHAALVAAANATVTDGSVPVSSAEATSFLDAVGEFVQHAESATDTKRRIFISGVAVASIGGHGDAMTVVPAELLIAALLVYARQFGPSSVEEDAFQRHQKPRGGLRAAHHNAAANYLAALLQLLLRGRETGDLGHRVSLAVCRALEHVPQPALRRHLLPWVRSQLETEDGRATAGDGSAFARLMPGVLGRLLHRLALPDPQAALRMAAHSIRGGPPCSVLEAAIAATRDVSTEFVSSLLAITAPQLEAGRAGDAHAPRRLLLRDVLPATARELPPETVGRLQAAAGPLGTEVVRHVMYYAQYRHAAEALQLCDAAPEETAALLEAGLHEDRGLSSDWVRGLACLTAVVIDDRSLLTEARVRRAVAAMNSGGVSAVVTWRALMGMVHHAVSASPPQPPPWLGQPSVFETFLSGLPTVSAHERNDGGGASERRSRRNTPEAFEQLVSTAVLPALRRFKVRTSPALAALLLDRLCVSERGAAGWRVAMETLAAVPTPTAQTTHYCAALALLARAAGRASATERACSWQLGAAVFCYAQAHGADLVTPAHAQSALQSLFELFAADDRTPLAAVDAAASQCRARGVTFSAVARAAIKVVCLSSHCGVAAPNPGTSGWEGVYREMLGYNAPLETEAEAEATLSIEQQAVHASELVSRLEEASTTEWAAAMRHFSAKRALGLTPTPEVWELLAVRHSASCGCPPHVTAALAAQHATATPIGAAASAAYIAAAARGALSDPHAATAIVRTLTSPAVTTTTTSATTTAVAAAAAAAPLIPDEAWVGAALRVVRDLGDAADGALLATGVVRYLSRCAAIGEGLCRPSGPLEALLLAAVSPPEPRGWSAPTEFLAELHRKAMLPSSPIPTARVLSRSAAWALMRVVLPADGAVPAAAERWRAALDVIRATADLQQLSPLVSEVALALNPRNPAAVFGELRRTVTEPGVLTYGIVVDSCVAERQWEGALRVIAAAVEERAVDDVAPLHTGALRALRAAGRGDVALHVGRSCAGTGALDDAGCALLLQCVDTSAGAEQQQAALEIVLAEVRSANGAASWGSLAAACAVAAAAAAAATSENGLLAFPVPVSELAADICARDSRGGRGRTEGGGAAASAAVAEFVKHHHRALIQKN